LLPRRKSTATPPSGRDAANEHSRTPRSFLLLLLALAAVAAFAAAPPADAAARRLAQPRLSDIAVTSGSVRYGRVGTASLSGLSTDAFWGGLFTTAAGERVTIYVSPSYPVDQATGQRWADFLGSLLHGPEISTLTSYIVTPTEVSDVCGQDALACYGDSKLVIPGEDTPDATMEALIAHEYGHHVAANRRNDPWQAVDWGTKRWATYEQVCARTKAGQLFPGAEDASNYDRNPGEGFAETYRVLNERRLGVAEAPWQIVNEILYPDATALSLLQQDVTAPWNGNASSTHTGSFSAAAPTKTITAPTPRDGSLSISVRAPKTGRVSLDLFTSAGTRVGHMTAGAAGTATVKATVCGSRTYRARVSRLSGSGTFRLVISKP
jgi:hypothetical protein